MFRSPANQPKDLEGARVELQLEPERREGQRFGHPLVKVEHLRTHQLADKQSESRLRLQAGGGVDNRPTAGLDRAPHSLGDRCDEGAGAGFVEPAVDAHDLDGDRVPPAAEDLRDQELSQLPAPLALDAVGHQQIDASDRIARQLPVLEPGANAVDLG